MIRATLNAISTLFQEQRTKTQLADELFNEAVLMTLARATSADSNINKVEVALVQEKVKQVTGFDISSPDVHVAANSKLYEQAPLDNYLWSISPRLSKEQRVAIVEALAEIIRADNIVTQREVRFFNIVAQSLRLDYSDLVHLQPTD